MASRRGLLIGATTCALMWSGAVAAPGGAEERGIDPHQGENLVEVHLGSKAAAVRLQLQAERYGVDFNEHYLRKADDGSVTVTVFGTDDEIAALDTAGYEVGVTIEGRSSWRNRIQARQTDVAKERRADDAALDEPVVTPFTHEDELVVLRVDYFENYAGRFLSVEAKTRLASVNDPPAPDPTPTTYTGPTLSLSWDSGPGTPIASRPRTMNLNIDTDTTPDTYIEHRELVRIGAAGTSSPRRPDRIRIGSSTGATIEAEVNTWVGGGLPPMGNRYLRDFTTRYMDPTEIYQRFGELAREFPNIAQLIPLPNRTNGYQRRAQATMEGTTPPGNSFPNDDAGQAQAARAVVLTSRAWGHEGGNDITAEFIDPGQPNSPLAVTMTGNNLLVRLATDGTGALTSTAAAVVAAINANAQANARLVAVTYRGNAGTGIVLPRARVNLSDFLSTGTNAHVPRGPFRYSVMRIGKRRDGSRTGVFLYCQQHAREWATPLTCLETAEQLLRNYAINRQTRRLVNNLDIFILPSSNPDGGHYSMHNFNFQRRNLTNHCVVGGKETDDENAANFWTPRTNPSTGAPYVNSDPGSRNGWGVDLNRNNTFATVFDGYIGASLACNSDVYAGPAEASEPEIRNELWIADTFKNIKFSNNIHSFGGYFMWAPGSYLPDRSEGEAVHANIGIEKYFFAAGERILNRIKEIRNTVILPERTGPIADVLYSAAGNSADEHWYNRDVIAYSFETGADRFAPTVLNVATAAGATGIRVADRSWWDPGDPIVIGYGTPNAETRTVAQVINPNPQSPAANIILTEPLTRAHAEGTAVWGEISQVGVGFQPPYATEGKYEALEFAAGNIGLLESAYAYSRDFLPPRVRMTNTGTSRGPVETTFEFVNEPSVIHYTMDGSRPTEQSPVWDATGPREPGEVFHIDETTTIRWRAEDIRGNVSYGRATFRIRPARD